MMKHNGIYKSLFKELTTVRHLMWPMSYSVGYQCLWVQDGMMKALQLSVSGNEKSIALFTMNNKRKDCFLEIWMMKEYCIKESWTKLITFGAQGPEWCLPRVLCFRKRGEVLLALVGYRYGGTNELVSTARPCEQIVESYEESIVSLDKTVAASHEENEYATWF